MDPWQQQQRQQQQQQRRQQQQGHDRQPGPPYSNSGGYGQNAGSYAGGGVGYGSENFSAGYDNQGGYVFNAGGSMPPQQHPLMGQDDTYHSSSPSFSFPLAFGGGGYPQQQQQQMYTQFSQPAPVVPPAPPTCMQTQQQHQQPAYEYAQQAQSQSQSPHMMYAAPGPSYADVSLLQQLLLRQQYSGAMSALVGGAGGVLATANMPSSSGGLEQCQYRYVQQAQPPAQAPAALVGLPLGGMSPPPLQGQCKASSLIGISREVVNAIVATCQGREGAGGDFGQKQNGEHSAGLDLGQKPRTAPAPSLGSGLLANKQAHAIGIDTSTAGSGVAAPVSKLGGGLDSIEHLSGGTSGDCGPSASKPEHSKQGTKSTSRPPAYTRGGGSTVKTTSNANFSVSARRKRHRQLLQENMDNPSLARAMRPPSLDSLVGPDHLVASVVPSSFPPELVYRTLSSYALLRTMSLQLSVSPFTPQAFLRALALPVPSTLIGAIHPQILRLLYENRNLGSYLPRGDGIRASKNRRDCDGVKRITDHPRAGENLAYLDGWSWPLFYDDYCSIMEDSYLDSLENNESLVNSRCGIMQNMHGAEKMGFVSDSREFKIPPGGEPFGGPSIMGKLPTAPDQCLGAAGIEVMGAIGRRSARRRARPQVSINESDATSHNSSFSGVESDDFDDESSDDEYRPSHRQQDWRGQERGGRGGRFDGSAENNPISADGEASLKKPRGRPSRQELKRAIATSNASDGTLMPPYPPRNIESTEGKANAVSISLGGASAVLDVEFPSEVTKVTNTGRATCRDDGCMKASRGKRFDYKCIYHFRLSNGEVATPHAISSTHSASTSRAAAVPPSTLNATMHRGDMKPRHSRRICSASGCTKASRGSKFDFMCVSHYKEMKGETAISRSVFEATHPRALDPPSRRIVPSQAFPNGGGAGARIPVSPPCRAFPSTTPIANREINLARQKGRWPINQNGWSTLPRGHSHTKKQRLNNVPLTFSRPNSHSRGLPLAPKSVATMPPPTSNSRSLTISDGTHSIINTFLSIKSDSSSEKTGTEKDSTVAHIQYDVQFERSKPLGISLKKDSITSEIRVVSVHEGEVAASTKSVSVGDVIVRIDSACDKPLTLGDVALQVRNKATKYALITFRTPVESAIGIAKAALLDLVDQVELQREVTMSLGGIIDCVEARSYPLYPSVCSILDMNVAEPEDSLAAGVTETDEKPTQTRTIAANKGTAESATPEKVRSFIAADRHVSRSDPVAQPRENKSSPGDLLPLKRPILRIRRGKPYHRLPISAKLEMLEYLLDEIISCVPGIRTELIRRDASLETFCSTGFSGRPHGAPYGRLAASSELENLANHDDCGVCGLEGDLLCCDGCVMSYHQRCIDLCTSLPEGKWFCPECEVADPTKLGPLHGGKKGSLDWFSLGHLGMELPPAASVGSSEDETITSASVLARAEFLIVHGFVFARDGQSKEPLDVDKLLSIESSTDVEVCSSALFSVKLPKIPTPLSQKQLFSLLKRLGPKICAEWPWSQVPFDPEKTWSDKQLLAQDVRPSSKGAVSVGFQQEPLPSPCSDETISSTGIFPQTQSASESRWPSEPLVSKAFLMTQREAFLEYFDQTSKYNPLVYSNKYRHTALNNGKRHHHHHFDAEGFFHYSEIFNAMSRDFSADSDLVSVLRKQPELMDPVDCIKKYIAGLEQRLSRASLLSALWGTEKAYVEHGWHNKVMDCRKIQALASLLVDLIDSTHSRAFHSEWKILPIGKTRISDSFGSETDTDVFKMFFSLASDWSPSIEISRRNWERSETSDVLSLLVSESGVSWPLFRKDSCTAHGPDLSKKRKSTTPRQVLEDELLDYGGNESSNPLRDETKATAETSVSSGALTQSYSHTTSNAEPNMGSHAQTHPLPKRNLPAFRHFCNSKIAELKATGDCSFAAQTRYCSKLWKNIDPEEKAKHQSIANEDKARYQREAEERDKAIREATSLGVVNSSSVPIENLAAAGDTETSSREDTGAGNDMDAASSSSPRRKPTRGSRRRSGRVQKQRAIHGEIGGLYTGPASTYIKDLGHGELLMKGEHKALMSEAKNLKICELEKIIRQHPLETDPILKVWPLAGRKIFDPEGSMPKSVARWLGRNAGVKRIPRVTYSDDFEVGRPSVCHIWRRKTLECQSIEELSLQLQFLDSFLDEGTLRSCESLARRCPSAKNKAQKVISCSHRDPATGKLEYFLVNKGKRRGCWVNEDLVDLSPLILFNGGEVEASIAEARKEKAAKLMTVARTQKDEAARATPNCAKPAQVAPQSEASAGASAPRPPALPLPGREGIVKCKQLIHHLFLQHQEDSVRMLHDAAKKGLRTTPLETLNPMRVKLIDEMKKINSQLTAFGSAEYHQAALMEKLVKAEQEATKAFIKEANKAVACGEKRKSNPENDSTTSPKRQKKSNADTCL